VSPAGVVVWIDGELVEPGARAVAVDDHGLTVGDGVFETLLVRGGRPGFWDRHMARLARSLQVTGMRPVDRWVLVEAVRAVLARRGPLDTRLRITVTSGRGPGGLGRGPSPTVLVTGSDVPPPGPAVRAVTVPWPRNERSILAGVKSTSYGEAAALQAHLAERGADDVVLCDTAGRVSEALTANVLVSLGGRAITPSLASGCLPGIVREVLLEAGVVEESDLGLDELAAADEVLLTSSVAGVRPVASLDGRPFPDLDGPLQRRAREAFAAAEGADAATGGGWPGTRAG
jgi:branched-chain amino acid aminotransferase